MRLSEERGRPVTAHDYVDGMEKTGFELRDQYAEPWAIDHHFVITMAKYE